MSEDRKRLHLEVPAAVRDRVERLCASTGADGITDVIRRALAVYDAVVTAQNTNGCKIIVREADGTERELLIV